MKATTDKTLGLITLIVIALICVPLMWFTLGTDSGTATGWDISPRITDSGDLKGESVILKTEGTVSSIYVNVGEIYVAGESGEITFTLDFSDSENAMKNDDYVLGSRREFTIFQNGERSYGWVKLAGSLSYSQKYVKISSTQSFELKEVVFTDKKDNRLETTCYGGLVWEGNARKFVSAQNDKAGTFSLVCDEQDSFELKGVSVLNDRESEIQSAVSNLLKSEGYYVSKTANALGVELIALGTLIFGENPFGLRIIPFLFFVATLYLLFFFGKKLFGANLYGMLTTVCYLVAGLGLSLAGLGLSYSIAVFFAVASLYFTYNLFVKGMQTKNAREWLREALMSGLFLCLAVLCDISSLIIAPVVLAVYIVLMVRAIKARATAYKTASGLEIELNREVLNKTVLSTVLGFFVIFAVLPILINLLVYGLAFPSYAGYYATENLFAIIAKNYSNLFLSLSGTTHFGWIIGLGSQKLNNFGGSVIISANKAFALLSTLSALVLGILYVGVNKQKVVSGGIIVGIKDTRNAILYVIYAFTVCWIANLIFIGKNEYYSYIYTLIPATLCTVGLFKVLQQNLKKGVCKGVAIAIVAIVSLFFLAQFVTFIQVAIPSEVAKYLYGWMM